MRASRASTPSLTVEPAAAFAMNSEFRIQNSEFVQIVGASRSGEEARSGGLGFGLLVHDLLAEAPFGASRAVLDDLAAVKARVLGLSGERTVRRRRRGRAADDA